MKVWLILNPRNGEMYGFTSKKKALNYLSVWFTHDQIHWWTIEQDMREFPLRWDYELKGVLVE